MTKNLIVATEDETGATVARRPYGQVHVINTEFLGKDAMRRMANEAHDLAPVNQPGAIDVAKVRFQDLQGMEPEPGLIPKMVAKAMASTGVYKDTGRFELAMWERFDYLTCRGATFHNDKFDGWSECLFWVLVLDAVDCEMVMPDIGLRLALEPGQLIVFDPQLVHGICRPRDKGRMLKSHFAGEHGHQCFLSGELKLDLQDWAALGCPWLPADTAEFAGAVDLQQVQVNPRTGAVKMPSPRRLTRPALSTLALP
ncbi:hypothetical protein ABIC83_002836 [Roseateles asaccharophilus]|uniref:hypothetical protein n=1 Tax=Roseateles asaccharophilus TaxID=582607 RepID=UPI0038389656